MPALVGNREHAFEIWESVHRHNRPDDKVWKQMHGGGIRDVFLHIPTQVVYKVDYGAEPGYGNKTELKHARALRKMQSEGSLKRVEIPKVSGFTFGNDVVIAMEYVKGTSGVHWGNSSRRAAEARRELYNLGFEDMHGSNYFIKSNPSRVVPIDMASPRRVKRKDSADYRVLIGLPEYDRMRESHVYSF